MRKLKQVLPVLKEITSIWVAANIPTLGAAIAYYTIFAIAPLFILVLAVAGALFSPDAARRELFGQLSGLVGPAGGQAIEATIASAHQPKASILATTLGLCTLFIGAGSVFIQLQSSLNVIWNVRPKAHHGIRNFIKNRLLSFATLLGIGFLLLVSLVISAGLSAAGQVLSGVIPAEQTVWQVIDFAASLGLVTVLFALIFKVLPDAIISWRDVWFGALVTALLFVFGKFLLGFYLGRSAFASAYGATGSLIVVLLWVYYSVQILLVGAAITRVWANRFGSQIEPARNAEFVEGKKEDGT